MARRPTRRANNASGDLIREGLWSAVM